eukprot:TRINITY_DN8250_c0_g1_i2.p1 TRINITY_DN8250_c0_g1~~TRINITY_DN8250_c0_g1_i2.p1  ORF type:complete len:495 (+),score=137.58 TRINITY_DN8250_c0_g1_i2:113-1597(+)
MANSLAVSYNGQGIPETNQEVLDQGVALCCAFNRRGSLLAVGCNDGRALLWDLDTRGLAQALYGHTQSVTSVSWSRSSQKLLTSSTDHRVIFWNIVKGLKLFEVQFDQPVLHATLRPRNSRDFVACPLISAPVRVRMPADLDGSDKEERSTIAIGADLAELATTVSAKRAATLATVAQYSRNGKQLYIGSPQGGIYQLNADTLAITKHIQAGGKDGAIKALSLSTDGRFLVAACADKFVRVFDTDGMHVVHKIQDSVNKVRWRSCCFSAKDDYIMAGAIKEYDHDIYIWERETGSLAKILTGDAQGMATALWHPHKPMIVSVSAAGRILLWGVTYTDNWSAFAPDFKEVEDNVEYIEREDEFDDVDAIGQPEITEEQMNEPVDIITVERDTYGSSDEEPLSEDELLFIPVVPIDDSEMALQAAEDDRAALTKRAENANKVKKKKGGRQDKPQVKKPVHRPGQRRKRKSDTAGKTSKAAKAKETTSARSAYRNGM